MATLTLPYVRQWMMLTPQPSIYDPNHPLRPWLAQKFNFYYKRRRKNRKIGHHEVLTPMSVDVFTLMSADVFNPISLGVCHADLCGCSHSDICGWFYSVDSFILIFVDVLTLISADVLL